MRRAVEGSNRPGYHAMAQSVSRRHITAEARVGFVVDKVAMGQSPPPTTSSISPVSIIPPTLCTHSVIYHRNSVI